jgi:hypothetical protein
MISFGKRDVSLTKSIEAGHNPTLQPYALCSLLAFPVDLFCGQEEKEHFSESPWSSSFPFITSFLDNASNLKRLSNS